MNGKTASMIGFAALVLWLPARADDLSILKRSPFLPPGHGEEAAAGPPPVSTGGPLSSRLEFRGLYELNGEYRFLLGDRQTMTSRWVRLNDGEGTAPFKVTDFNQPERAVYVSFEGQQEWLQMVKTSNAVAMMAQNQPPNVNIQRPPGRPRPVRPAVHRRIVPPPQPGGPMVVQPSGQVQPGYPPGAAAMAANQNPASTPQPVTEPPRPEDGVPQPNAMPKPPENPPQFVPPRPDYSLRPLD